MLYTPDGDLVSSPLYTFAYDEDDPPPPLPEDGFAAAAGSSAAGSAAGSRPGRPRGGGGEGGFDYGEGMLEVEEEEDLEEEEEERSYPPVEPYEFAGYIGVKQASGGKKREKIEILGGNPSLSEFVPSSCISFRKILYLFLFSGNTVRKILWFLLFQTFFLHGCLLNLTFSIACLKLEMLYYCKLLSGSKLKTYGISFSSIFSSFVSKSIQEKKNSPSLLNRIFHSSACQTIWLN